MYRLPVRLVFGAPHSVGAPCSLLRLAADNLRSLRRLAPLVALRLLVASGALVLLFQLRMRSVIRVLGPVYWEGPRHQRQVSLEALVLVPPPLFPPVLPLNP